MSHLSKILCWLSVAFIIPATLDSQVLGSDSACANLYEPFDPFAALSIQLPPSDSRFSTFPQKQAVRVTEVIPNSNRREEGHYLLEKTGDTWRALFSNSSPFALHSDPTWPFSILGARLSHFFGLKIISDRVLRVPTAERLNLYIQEANKKLAQKGLQPIHYRFSSKLSADGLSGGHLMGPSEVFVRRFIKDRIFPLTSGDIIHETAHHFTNILLSDSQMKPIEARMNALIDFADFLRSDQANKLMREKGMALTQDHLREDYLNLVFQLASREVDDVTGMLPVILVRNKPVQGVAHLKDETPYIKFQVQLGETSLGVLKEEKFVDSPPFSVDNWLRRISIKNLDPLLSNPTSELSLSSSYFMSRARNKGMRQQINQQTGIKTFIAELRTLYTEFSRTRQSQLSQVLAAYQNDGTVVGGLADPNNPILAAFERIHQLRTAIAH